MMMLRIKNKGARSALLVFLVCFMPVISTPLIVTAALAAPAATHAPHIRTTPRAVDMDMDGLPDATELIDETDRSRFRLWFTAVAESQFYAIHPDWPAIRHDCTGLICFAYKEALKTHNGPWLRRFKYITNPAIPDINAFRYPNIPLIGTNLFRSVSGPFQGQDLENGAFQPIATARVLMDYNCRFIGKELDETIMEGDLLFYSYFKGERQVFHAMILVKIMDTRDGMDGVVVYHTGPDGDYRGEVRRLRISTLNQHPDDIWHVKLNNPYFLGFYRLNIQDYNYINKSFCGGSRGAVFSKNAPWPPEAKYRSYLCKN